MKLNRTTQRTVEILKMISRTPEGATLDDLCEKLNLPKTSAYDIVTTLAEMGMVNVARGQKQSYTIGLMAYRIGINYTNNLDFISTIEPVLKAFWARPCFLESLPTTTLSTYASLNRRIRSLPRRRWVRRIPCTAPRWERSFLHTVTRRRESR